MNDWDAGAMYGHLQQCERCARLDVVVRRGLLVARNLPPIHPSRDFMPRLEARLRERPLAAVPADADWTARSGWSKRMRWTASISTGIVVAILGLFLTRAGRGTPLPAPPPAAAIATGRTMSRGTAAVLVPAVSPEFMASLASGIPVWPGISIGDRAASHLAQVELQTASLSP